MGACLYAAIFGNIAQLIAKLDAPGTRYQTQQDKIDEFTSFHRLPAKLRTKVSSRDLHACRQPGRQAGAT